jgi:D-glycero-beta-D-manno-heptose-7-phosphate kinase
VTPAHPLVPLIAKLAGHRLLVIGDVFLDEYLIGSANRLSREAPIPVLEFERSELIPGGAANPSANVASLGSTAIQIGVVGDDSGATAFREMLSRKGVDPSGLITDPSRPTTTKTRIMAQMGLRFPQQMARIDKISRAPISGEVEQQILACIDSLAEQVSAIIVSDYLTGLLTNRVVDAIRVVGGSRSLLLAADAQGELGKYTGFDLVKCNADEAARYTGRDLRTDADYAQAGQSMVETMGLRGMLITRGPDGVTLSQRDQTAVHIPAIHVEDVYDTVGAGDTVLAVMTLALVAGASYIDAAALANVAAGIVVRKVGNYAPTPDDLRLALHEQPEA